MDESYQKAILSLVSVFVGWFLGQGTNLFQKWLDNRRIKKALLNELEDIKILLSGIKSDYERYLKIYCENTKPDDIPLKIPHHIYTKYFSDILIKLNHSQRHSYQLIHGYIDAFNSKIDLESEIIKDYFITLDKRTLELWGASIQSQYSLLCSTIWHINYHLLNKENPDLTSHNVEADENYTKFMSDCDKIAADILKTKRLNK